MNINTRKLPALHEIPMSFFKKNAQKGEIPYLAKYEGYPLASPAQGIYSPANSDYCLSIKQTLRGPYADTKRIYFEDGSWIFAYHQQGTSSKEDLERLKNNQAIVKNMKEQVPLGIWFQTQEKGRNGARYEVAIGIPLAWIDGFFIIAGPNEDGEINDDLFNMTARELLNLILEGQVIEFEDDEDSFDPNNVVDERKKAMRQIVQRQGQPAFRRALLKAYKGICPITGCDIVKTLEAAHITPYLGEETNKVQNGLPLRCDIHNLWDYGMICVDSDSMTVILHPDLQDGYYAELHGKKLQLPIDPADHPSKAALDAHRETCCF